MGLLWDDAQGRLLIADAIQGLLRVSGEGGQAQVEPLLTKVSHPVPDDPVRYADAIKVGADGTLWLAGFPLQPGVVIRARPVGVLKMEDEGGVDAKVVAVPVSKLTPLYDKVQTTDDLPELLMKQTVHFFEHYKDLEPGKWVKVLGWGTVEDAKQEILNGLAAAAK